jgi:DNA helicase HerA-like ATPase
VATTTMMAELKKLASIDLFDEARGEDRFVGRPFYLDFARLRLLSNDKWKHNVGGIPAGAFLLCTYVGEESVHEALLVRVLGPTKLPTDDDVVASMVDYYKESLPTSPGKLDSYTRAEFQFSGLDCRVLGTFYRNDSDDIRFAGDLDNFYAPHNYLVYKPAGKALEYIVNYRDEGVPTGSENERIAVVRYSSSLRHSSAEEGVPVFVSPFDFLGKRTALFGMTRTGKSNTVKKLIQATVAISKKANTVDVDGEPLDPVGQIIFDVNGEYANANQQDAGTAIFEQYKDVERYSVLEKEGFKVMKLNFYRDVEAGYGLLTSLLADDAADYTRAFCNIDWERPAASDVGAKTRYDRKVAAYKICLFKAGFTPPSGEKVKFTSSAGIRSSGIAGLDGVEPKNGISLEDAQTWFEAAWRHYRDPAGPFELSKAQTGREWADEDLQTLLRFLSRTAKPGGSPSETGFRKLIRGRDLHTATVGKSFEDEILDLLREGEIVIIDLSQGDPAIQQTYSDRVCRHIFGDAIERFIRNERVNYIQMYFEEAHNLFPRKEEKDLTLIYNRLAKEGQKLRLGLNYATQEVSSISASILKNTQNWFVSHLNNQDELREIQKFYDFEDFTESLRRTTDKGFIRMKTDSNTFIVPVQIDRFVVAGKE